MGSIFSQSAHLLRKFVMDTLSSQGLNEFEVKIIVGKAIPLSDATYLTTIKRTAFQKYQKAFSSFSLKGSESNHKFDRSHEDRTGSDLGSRTKLLSHTPCACVKERVWVWSYSFILSSP